MSERKSNRNYIILGALALLTILAFGLIYYFGDDNASADDLPSEENLRQEILDLESNILEMELVFEEKDYTLDQKERLLEEKYDQINALTQQIEELERQGKVDKQTIRELREKLGDARTVLLDKFKQEIDILVIDNSRLTRVMDSMLQIIATNDSLIEVVYQERMELEAQVEECQESAGGTAPTTVRNGFAAENIRFFSKKGNNESPGKLFQVRDIESLKVTFDLVGYGNAPNGNQAIHMVLIDKSGRTYMDPGSSGRWVFNGQEKAYSMKAVASYLGSKQEISQVFSPGEEGFLNGPNRLEVYANGNLIGQAQFLIAN